jgi:hypothetical protein
MTPRELRERAVVNVENARTLFDQQQYDNASYLAGYAVELVLKARFCTRRGWADFPDSRAEAKQRGAPDDVTHDLEKLLMLSDGVCLKASSMQKIDWARATDWSSEQRYNAVGSVTREHAEAQIAETKKLVIEMVLFEIVERLVVVEPKVSEEMGPFNLFILGDCVTQRRGWEVLMSAWWLVRDTGDEVVKRLREVLDPDLRRAAPTVTTRHPHDDWVQRFHAYLPAQHRVRYITSHNFVIDRHMPRAFIITNVPRNAPEPRDSPDSTP